MRDVDDVGELGFRYALDAPYLGTLQRSAEE